GYYLILFFSFRKMASAFPKVEGRRWMPAMSGVPPELIDRPGIVEEEINVSLDKENYLTEPALEMVDDEENILLKAAEIVVEKVQDVVNHIASSPPNPDEVLSKLKFIVNQYQIFKNTEYFDAINSFIAITVERDCSLQ